jgi:hypothetical protein
MSHEGNRRTNSHRRGKSHRWGETSAKRTHERAMVGLHPTIVNSHENHLSVEFDSWSVLMAVGAPQRPQRVSWSASTTSTRQLERLVNLVKDSTDANNK